MRSLWREEVWEVKGTKVLAVQKRNLSLLTGAEWKFGHRMERIQKRGRNTHGENGGDVNRILKGMFVAVICGALAGAGALLAQDSGKKASGTNAAAVGRGRSLFQQKCSICHYDTSDQKKIGPGLKGLSKRGTFSVNGNKITDDSLKTWIESGDQLMPPFKDVLEPAQIKDVVAYVKTL
jgi:cytochrome c